jgi:hypothetical protein
MDRFTLINSALPNEVLVPLWTIWSILSFVAGSLSLATVCIVFLNPSLRKRAFNKYIAALSIPDAVFSLLCAVDCLRNAIDGQWIGGAGKCGFQVPATPHNNARNNHSLTFPLHSGYLRDVGFHL